MNLNKDIHKVIKNPITLTLYTIAAVLVFALAVWGIRTLPAQQIKSSQVQLTGDLSTDQFVNIVNCYSQPQAEQSTCLDEFVAAYAKRYDKDTKAILADEEAARAESEVVENSCHPIAHAIGRYTFKVYGNVGDAFNACDQSCHSGCYHGVMERMFYSDEQISSGSQHLTYDDLVKKVPGICDRDKFSNPNSSMIFQCLHGLGHALMYSLRYDLRTALKTCDLLADDYQRSSCYGGVVMENVTAFDKSLRDLKRDDPLYPCDSLDDKYQDQCYVMQTSVMSEYGMTIEQIVAECQKAGKYVRQCFVSLGRDLSNFVRIGDVEPAVQACEVTSGINSAGCFEGILYALFDNTWDARFAFKYCDALDEVANREFCYKVTNAYMDWAYNFTKDQVREQCDKYSEEIDMCKQQIY